MFMTTAQTGSAFVALFTRLQDVRKELEALPTDVHGQIADGHDRVRHEMCLDALRLIDKAHRLAMGAAL